MIKLPSSENVCFSGGSKGADQVFGEQAERVGHTVQHYTFFNHLSPCKKVVRLNVIDLLAADDYLKVAARILGRSYPPKTEYVTNLLRRNYYQIENTEKIFAVGLFETDTTQDTLFGSMHTGPIKSGTGWTVALGIIAGIKEIYFFDHVVNQWFEFVPGSNPWQWKQVDSVPRPSGWYTGIGSHDLPAHGSDEIKNLYL